VKHVGSLSLTLAIANSFVRKHLVDFLHDLFRLLNACGDQLVAPWAPLRPSEQVASPRHVDSGQDGSHDPEHAFAPFVHCAIIELRLLFV
jgi:hypothetical protein